MVIAIILLSLALIFCAAVIFLLKRDIRTLALTLQMIKKTDTNMRLTTKTFDKNIIGLCGEINNVLDEQQKVIALSKKSNREFRQAITNISHDLRTPLTSAIGYIQLIKSDKAPDHKKQEYLNSIEYRLKSLSKQQNDLFEYTRILEGKIYTDSEKVNICNILRDSISANYEDFINKNFSVEINVPDIPINVMCNSNSIKRVVQNLIQNVLIHGKDRFCLSIDTNNNILIFENDVTDMDALEIDRLFDRFYTADFSRSGNTTGLGLAIARELVHNMGGNITAATKNNSLVISVYLPFII